MPESAIPAYITSLIRHFEDLPDGHTVASQVMAEREGFEPPIPFQVCRFSRPVPSTTRPPLRLLQFYYSRDEFVLGSPARASRSHERTVAPLRLALRDSRRAGGGS